MSSYPAYEYQMCESDDCGSNPDCDGNLDYEGVVLPDDSDTPPPEVAEEYAGQGYCRWCGSFGDLTRFGRAPFNRGQTFCSWSCCVSHNS